MYQARCAFGIFFVDDHRDFNLRGRYQLNIDRVAAKAFEQPRRDSRMRSHPDSDDT
jgi:hypothetical protein